MPTLQKFKLFATQCAAIHIPTQSPTTSPLFHSRRPRRKTLRMLLARRNQTSDAESDYQHKSKSRITPKRSKLKDLFVAGSSSPTNFTHRRDAAVGDDQERGRKSSGIEPKQQPGRIIRPVSVRPVFGCRNRMLLRKPWRPVLSTIEEF